VKRKWDEAAEACLPEIGQGLLPEFAADSVVRDPFNVLVDPASVQPLDGRGDARVQVPAPLLKLAAVGDLVGQRMLEGIREIRKEARLVEELGALEMKDRPSSPAPNVVDDPAGRHDPELDPSATPRAPHDPRGFHGWPGLGRVHGRIHLASSSSRARVQRSCAYGSSVR
jgi:hypothetical protein